MRGCLDEGILQSYFDGELSSESVESVTSHLLSCRGCSAAARDLESESNLLETALAPEFDCSVPSERLRHRVTAAVAGLHVVPPVQEEAAAGIRGWFRSFPNLFTIRPQWAFGYAGLAVVLAFAAIFWMTRLRPAPPVSPHDTVVLSGKDSPNKPAPVNPPASSEPIATNITTAPNTATAAKISRSVKPRLPAGNQETAVKLMPGERSYLKTIAALDSTIKNDRPMRPALQAEYERNLALVDRALAAARNAAKSNPNDPDTAEFVFAAYQSKVDLLNTVADARLYNRQQ